MARSKHILPFLLEGAVQEIDSLTADASWNRLTSFVNVNISSGQHDFTVGSPLQNVPGALLSIHKQGDGGRLDVQLGTLALDDEFDELNLLDGDHSVLLMWNGEKWVVLSQSLEKFVGGTLTSSLTANSYAFFYDTATFFQGDPAVAPDSDADLTASDIASRIITCDPSVARTKSMPLIGDMINAIPLIDDDQSFDFTIINISSTSGATVTITPSSSMSIVGSAVISEGTSGTFRIRRSTLPEVYRL